MLTNIRQVNFKIILALITVLNFYTWAYFSQKPENVHDFELQMVEHSLGVGITMQFLLSQSFIAEDPDFKILLEHKSLVARRAKQHDMSKFTHTPEFVSRYYPSDTTGSLSKIVYKYYGWDIRTKPKELTSVQISEASTAFQTLNALDTDLLNDLMLDYKNEKNLDQETTDRLEWQLKKLETIADLINRKMFENISRYRRNSAIPKGTQEKSKEVFEFGHQVDLYNKDPYFWNNQMRDQSIAVRFFHSPILFHLIADIDEDLVAKTYRNSTKNSPFITDQERVIQEVTIGNYLTNRKEIKDKEKRDLFKKQKYRNPNLCRIFYSI